MLLFIMVIEKEIIVDSKIWYFGGSDEVAGVFFFFVGMDFF